MAELWMNMPSKISQVHIVWFYLYEVSKIEKLIKTENINIIEVTRCRGRVGEMEHYYLYSFYLGWQKIFGNWEWWWLYIIVNVLQFSSVAQLCPTLCDRMNRSTPGLPVQPPNLPNPRNLPKFISNESVMPSNHLILCGPLLLPPSIFPSIRVFANESTLRIKWPKYWSFSSASVLPMNTQDWSPLGWTGWISLQSKRLSGVFSNTTVQKHQFFGAQLSF